RTPCPGRRARAPGARPGRTPTGAASRRTTGGFPAHWRSRTGCPPAPRSHRRRRNAGSPARTSRSSGTRTAGPERRAVPWRGRSPRPRKTAPRRHTLPAVRARHRPQPALARPAHHTPPPHRPPPCAPRRPHPPRLNGRTRRGPGGRRHHGPAPGPGLSRPITALRRCDVGRSAESSRGDAPCWRQYPGWCPGIRAGGKRRSRLRLLGVGLEPDLLAPVVRDRTGGVVGPGRAPAPSEPAAGATPCVAGPARPRLRRRVQPRRVAVEARPPDRVGGVRVHRGGGGDARPAALFVGVPVLQDAPALRAQARLAVHPGTVAGRAAVALPVAERGLPPPAF